MQKLLPPHRKLCSFILNNCLQINSPMWLMQHCLDFLLKIINIYYLQHLPQYQAPATKVLQKSKALLNQVPHSRNISLQLPSINSWHLPWSMGTSEEEARQKEELLLLVNLLSSCFPKHLEQCWALLPEGRHVICTNNLYLSSCMPVSSP